MPKWSFGVGEVVLQEREMSDCYTEDQAVNTAYGSAVPPGLWVKQGGPMQQEHQLPVGDEPAAPAPMTEPDQSVSPEPGDGSNNEEGGDEDGAGQQGNSSTVSNSNGGDGGPAEAQQHPEVSDRGLGQQA